MKHLLALLAAWLMLPALAADLPYDEAADTPAQIRAALAAAAQTRRAVLLVFGANWCGDCKVLDQALKQGPTAALVAREFTVVKVNVGRFDRHLDIAEHYGVPLKQGIPAVAIVAPDDRVRYVTRAGELADARSLGEQGIHEFLARVGAAPETKP